MSAYAYQDQQHDRDLCEFDAKQDAWEADWSSLRHKIAHAVLEAGFDRKGSRDIIEKAAADIIDLQEE